MTVKEFVDNKVNNWIENNIDKMIILYNNDERLISCLTSEYVDQFSHFYDCEINTIDYYVYSNDIIVSLK